MKKVYIKLFIKVILIVLYLAIPNNTFSQFVQKSIGLNGGSIECFATSPGKIYAGAMYGGIYMSSNSGVNWVSINNNILKYYIETISIKNNEIFVGCSRSPRLGNGGYTIENVLFRSTNEGSNWEVIQNGFPYSWISVYSLLVFDDYIFAGTDDGIYRTYDSISINWKKVSGFNYSVFALKNRGNSIFAGTIGHKIYRSQDCGDSWQYAGDGVGNSNVTSFCIKNDKIFAGTDNGIYASRNNGDNWYGVNNGLTYTVIGSLCSYNNILIAGTYKGIYKSTDEGLNWTLANNGMPLSAFFAICFDGTNIYAGAVHHYYGIYKSTDNGMNWQKSDYGLYASNSWGIVSIGGNLFTVSDGQGAFESTNWGESWDSINNGINSPYIRQVETKGNYLFVENLNNIYRSSNYGSNWELVNSGLTNVNYVMSLHSNENDIYAGTFYKGLFKSTNNGNIWNLIGLNNTDIRAILKNGNLLFVGTDTEGMFYSSNEGANWIEINDGLPPKCFLYATALENIGNNVYLGNTWRGGIYMTTNNGTNWIKRNNGIYDSVVFAFTKQDSILFASDYTDGLYITKNLGQNWVCKGDGLHNKDVLSICIAGGYIFVACNGFGVWRRPISEVIFIRNVSSEIPVKNKLFQNYPNPFNSKTIIRFQVNNSKLTTIKIYNILGKEIYSHINEKLNPGTYEILFDGSLLSSGIYFYELNTDGFSETKKLVLIK